MPLQFNVLTKLVLGTLLLAHAVAGMADGLDLKDGRYIGPVAVFNLTTQQAQVIEHFRSCHLEHYITMNAFTPYVFELTHEQSHVLKKQAGRAPRYFIVYETYRGDNDAGPHWNVALRFNKDQIEVPLDLVLDDKAALEAHRVQGWELSNPCFPHLDLKSFAKK